MSTPSSFVSVTCELRAPLNVDGEDVSLIVFNDGGMGIEPVIRRHLEGCDPQDLAAFDNYENVELNPKLYCKRGLRASHYTSKFGGQATTWYLA